MQILTLLFILFLASFLALCIASIPVYIGGLLFEVSDITIENAIIITIMLAAFNFILLILSILSLITIIGPIFLLFAGLTLSPLIMQSRSNVTYAKAFTINFLVLLRKSCRFFD